MKTNFAFISVCLFLSALLGSILLSGITGNLYDQLFHPNYGWWGAPELVTIPISYVFFIVLLFTLWNRKKYYYPILIFLFPVWYMLLISIVSGFSINGLIFFVKLFILPGVIAFVLAKIIRFIISKFKRPNPPMVVR